MRYAIVSDIHSNFEALTACLEALMPFDRLWCLGDLVGYGPNPNECIALLREFDPVVIAGNHDLATTGALNIKDFNEDAADAITWTQHILTPEHHRFLDSLPSTTETDGYTLAHGSPRDPVWEYLNYDTVAMANFPLFQTQCLFVGHSHLPLIFEEQHDRQGDPVIRTAFFIAREKILMRNRRLIINPGSVGQPRDGDARASCALLNTDLGTIECFRVTYDYKTTQEKMMQAHLPPRLATRLYYGW